MIKNDINPKKAIGSPYKSPIALMCLPLAWLCIIIPKNTPAAINRNARLVSLNPDRNIRNIKAEHRAKTRPNPFQNSAL